MATQADAFFVQDSIPKPTTFRVSVLDGIERPLRTRMSEEVLRRLGVDHLSICDSKVRRHESEKERIRFLTTQCEFGIAPLVRTESTRKYSVPCSIVRDDCWEILRQMPNESHKL